MPGKLFITSVTLLAGSLAACTTVTTEPAAVAVAQTRTAPGAAKHFTGKIVLASDLDIF